MTPSPSEVHRIMGERIDREDPDRYGRNLREAAEQARQLPRGQRRVVALEGDPEPALTVFEDAHASCVVDDEGQGHVKVAGSTVHAHWACAVCGIPTGTRSRRCPHHPDAALFMRHIREAA